MHFERRVCLGTMMRVPRKWDGYVQNSAVSFGSDAELPSEFFDALAHAGKAHTHATTRPAEFFEKLGRNTPAVVGDAQYNVRRVSVGNDFGG